MFMNDLLLVLYQYFLRITVFLHLFQAWQAMMFSIKAVGFDGLRYFVSVFVLYPFLELSKPKLCSLISTFILIQGGPAKRLQ